MLFDQASFSETSAGSNPGVEKSLSKRHQDASAGVTDQSQTTGPLTRSDDLHQPNSNSPDGTHSVYHERHPEAGSGLHFSNEHIPTGQSSFGGSQSSVVDGVAGGRGSRASISSILASPPEASSSATPESTFSGSASQKPSICTPWPGPRSPTDSNACRSRISNRPFAVGLYRFRVLGLT